MEAGIFLGNLTVHFAIYHDFNRMIAVRTYRINGNRNCFIPQSPLHEGRGNRINRSGCV